MRCPVCGYDLKGNETCLCPECGADVLAVSARRALLRRTVLAQLSAGLLWLPMVVFLVSMNPYWGAIAACFGLGGLVVAWEGAKVFPESDSASGLPRWVVVLGLVGLQVVVVGVVEFFHSVAARCALP